MFRKRKYRDNQSKIMILMVLVGMFFMVSGQKAFDKQKEVDSLCNVIKTAKGIKKLENYKELMNATAYNPDIEASYKYIDEYIAETKKQKNIEHEIKARAAKVQMLFKHHHHTENCTFETEYERFMKFAYQHKAWDYYFEVWHQYVYFLIEENKYSDAFLEAQKMYKIGQSENNYVGVGYACFFTGLIYANNDFADKALPFYAEAIQHFHPLIKESNVLKSFPLWVTYAEYIYALQKVGKYEQTLPLIAEWEKEQQKRDQWRKYKEYIGWFNIDHKKIITYMGLKQFDKAQQYFDTIDAYIDYINDHNMSSYMGTKLDFYMQTGQTQKALKYVDSVIAFETQFHGGSHLYNRKKEKAILLRNTGYVDTATFDMLLDYMNYTDKFEKEKTAEQLNLFNTEYQVDRITLEKKRNLLLFIAAAVIAGLLLLLLVVYFLYSRKIHRKNRAIVAQILEQNQQAKQKLHHSPPTKEQLLFDKLEKYMQQSQSYLTENVNISDISRQLATNEKYLQNAIKECVNMTFAVYINTLRLQFACSMLSNPNNQATIDSIALDSGFGNRVHFHRLFVQKYGISPGEFRKNS